MCAAELAQLYTTIAADKVHPLHQFEMSLVLSLQMHASRDQVPRNVLNCLAMCLCTQAPQALICAEVSDTVAKHDCVNHPGVGDMW